MCYVKKVITISKKALIELGFEESVLLTNILDWLILIYNSNKEEMYYDGRLWCFFSKESFLKEHPYITEGGYKKALRKLKEKKYILVEQKKKSFMNRTNFYSLTEDGLRIIGDIYSTETVREIITDSSSFPYDRVENDPIDRVENDPINILNNNIKEKNTKKEKLQQFETAWNLYSKKIERKRAEKIWMKIKDSDIEKILKAIPKYVASTPDLKFRKHFSTWLNNECWNDEIEEKETKEQIDFFDISSLGDNNES